MKKKVYLLVCVGSKPNPIQRSNRKFYATLVQACDANRHDCSGWTKLISTCTIPYLYIKSSALTYYTQCTNIPITNISKFNYDQKRCAAQIDRLAAHIITQNLGGDYVPLLTLSQSNRSLTLALHLDLTCCKEADSCHTHSIVMMNTLHKRGVAITGFITRSRIGYLAVSVRHCLSCKSTDSLSIHNHHLASKTCCGEAAERVSIVNHTTNLNPIKSAFGEDGVRSDFELWQHILIPLLVHIHQVRKYSSSLCDVFYHHKRICQICSSLFLISIKTSVCGLLIHLINYRRYLTESAILNV